MKRLVLCSLLLAGLTACAKSKEASFPIPTAVAKRKNISVTAEATGKIEPINVIDIKSKAGGQITYMPVETGTHVHKGDTIVDLDKRDVQTSYHQAEADFEIAKKKRDNSKIVAARNKELFASHVITQADLETGDLDLQNQETTVLKAQDALDAADIKLKDATILAPQDGVILDKVVSMGTVIASASSSASGGTTLVRMADLTQVRARVNVSETDIGKVLPGLAASVLVDAYPNRPFEGVVGKLEPQAIIDQNVTMFPVLVNLDNKEGALMPGMNGEVQIMIEEKRGVLTIPLDAFRLANEAKTVAEMFGVLPERVDSVNAQGNRSRSSAATAPIADDSASQVPVGRDSAGGGATRGGGQAGGANRTGGRGGQGGQSGQTGGRGTRAGGANQVAVTDGDCTAVTAGVAKKPGLQDQIDALRASMRSAGADQTALNGQLNALYTSVGVNPQVAQACRVREMSGGAGRGGRGGGRGGRGGGRGAGGGGGGGAALGGLGQRNNGLGVRGQGLASAGIVFVQTGIDTTVNPPKPKFDARFVRLGSQNYDDAEVTDGLKEGEVVALMAAAKIEVQRRQAADKQKQNTSLIPGMNQGGRGAGGPGGPGGGGPPGGGGGGRGGRGG